MKLLLEFFFTLSVTLLLCGMLKAHVLEPLMRPALETSTSTNAPGIPSDGCYLMPITPPNKETTT